LKSIYLEGNIHDWLGRAASLKCSKISLSKTQFSAKGRFCKNQCGVDLRVTHMKRQTKLSGFDSHCLFRNLVWTSQCVLRLNTHLCDWKRSAEFLDFCIRTCRLVLWCLFGTSAPRRLGQFLRRTTWIVVEANSKKRIVLLSTNIKNQMLTTLHILVQIMKYLNWLKKNVQVTIFQYRRLNFYSSSNCILEGLLKICSHQLQPSKKGEQAKSGPERQKQ